MIPHVSSHDSFYYTKHDKPRQPVYEHFEMPKNTGLGVYIGGFSFLLGFGLVWHIWWLVLVGLLGDIICVIIRGCKEHVEYELTVAEVEKIEQEMRKR